MSMARGVWNVARAACDGWRARPSDSHQQVGPRRFIQAFLSVILRRADRTVELVREVVVASAPEAQPREARVVRRTQRGGLIQ